jgi:hypothetical protein
MKKVIAVTAKQNFLLDLTFDDGSRRSFDVKPYLDLGILQTQRSNYFKQVTIAFGTVQWPHEGHQPRYALSRKRPN